MSTQRLTLTPFERLPVGTYFYASNEKSTTFKKTSKDTWCLVLKTDKGRIIKTRDHKFELNDMVLI